MHFHIIQIPACIFNFKKKLIEAFACISTYSSFQHAFSFKKMNRNSNTTHGEQNRRIQWLVSRGGHLVGEQNRRAVREQTSKVSRSDARWAENSSCLKVVARRTDIQWELRSSCSLTHEEQLSLALGDAVMGGFWLWVMPWIVIGEGGCSAWWRFGFGSLGDAVNRDGWRHWGGLQPAVGTGF